MTLPRTQTDNILAHLQTVGPITPIEALTEFGCFRLGARVLELRKQGYPIKTTMVKVASGARVARYSLEDTQ